jgi:glycosyltransferase involved in cell wall biosynthesis
MKSRACIIRQAPYPQDQLVRREVETLHDAGFDVTVICSHLPTDLVQEEVNGVHVHRLSASNKKGGVLLYIYKYLRFFVLAAFKVTALYLKQPFDVIQVNTMPDFLVFCTLIPRLLGAKITLVMYEPMPELWATLYGNRWAVGLITLIQKCALRYAQAIFAVTEQQKETFVTRGGKPEKITVILNAPETRLWDDMLPLTRTPHDTFTLICHGAIEDRYGHDTMLGAIQRVKDQIPNLRLRILGMGSYQDEFLAQVKTLGLEPWVDFLGWTPLAQMVEALYNADVGIVAQKSSPYSNLVHTGKMYDYLSFGLPVLASRLKAVAAYFDDQSLYFFEPGDPESLAQGILDLYQYPEKRRSLVENSQRLYQQYQWEQQKQIYLAVYQNLLKDRR